MNSFESSSTASSVSPIQHYILCRDDKRRNEWEQRRAELPGVQLHLRSGFASIFSFIAEAIRETKEDYVVVSHDDVIMGFNFGERVHSLIGDLEGRFPNWGVAGNAGVSLDGKSYYVHVRDPWCEPVKSGSPQPVLTLDGNLMLINRRNFIAAGCEYPDLGGFHGYDLILALECLRKGLLVVSDPRLLTLHLAGGNKGVYQAFTATDRFLDYLRARFTNGTVPTMMGVVHVPRDGAPKPGCEDLQDLYDRALLATRKTGKASLTVVDIATGLRADDDKLDAIDRVADLDALRPLVDLVHRPATGRSASELGQALVDAIRTERSDHVWFLPDHARVERASLRQVARKLAVGTDTVVALWHRVDADGEEASLRSATEVVHASLRGARFEYWGAIYPTRVLRDRLAAGESPLEQIASLLPVLALTSPGVDLSIVHEVVVSGLAGTPRALPSGGFGSAADWDDVTRLATVLNDPSLGSPMLWTLSRLGAPHMWNPATRSLGERRSRIVDAATNAGQIVDAAVHVLRTPNGYLRRGMSLFADHVRRGDLKGLVRESLMFRRR